MPNAAPGLVAVGSVEWDHARRLAYAQPRAAGASAAEASVTEASAVEEVSLDEALGRVLARDLRALHDVPHYASSAMDGWAVSDVGPWRIDEPGAVLAKNHATPIVTGAVIPPGATAVLRSENAVVESTAAGARVLSVGPGARPGEPVAGQHVRPIGEEAKLGTVVLFRGTVLNPAHVAVAALGGHDVVPVARRPRVRFVFSGDEVVLAGIPSAGRVRDVFGPQLPGLLTGMGAHVLGARRCHDTLDDTVEALAASIHDSQLVITTGGTGHSSVDHLRNALRAVDARVVFDGIRMRPGGPTLLAEAPNGCLVACLPGNPLAAMVGLFTIVDPLLRSMLGRRAAEPQVVTAATDIEGRHGTTLVVPYSLENHKAWPSPWRGSGMMRGLAEADGLLVVDETGVRAGEAARALELPWSRG